MGLRDLFKKQGDSPDAGAAEIGTLIQRLSDADWKVRLEACRALAKFGPRARAAVSPLQELLVDDNGDVCNAAAAALSEIEND